MKQRTIELLKYCGMKMERRLDCPRYKEFQRLCEKYSEKAVYTKLDDLADKGYIEYGVNVRGSWLTDKGKETLAKVGD